MKPPIRWMIWLYPRAWRDRYCAELEALIEDSACGGADVFDVLKEAIKMRVLESWSFSQLAVVLGIAGVLMAAVSWAVAPPAWVSQAELKMSSPVAKADVNEELTARLESIQKMRFSAEPAFPALYRTRAWTSIRRNEKRSRWKM